MPLEVGKRDRRIPEARGPLTGGLWLVLSPSKGGSVSWVLKGSAPYRPTPRTPPGRPAPIPC